MESFICESSSAHEAEIAAILKATWMAKRNNWSNLLWSSDDQGSVQGVLSSTEPGGWNIRYDIIAIPNHFIEANWILIWSLRTSNRLVDAVAKLYLSWNFSMSFNDCNLNSIPNDLLNLARLDILCWLFFWEVFLCSNAILIIKKAAYKIIGRFVMF